MTDKPLLKIVGGYSKAPQKPKDGNLWECSVCLDDLGFATTMAIPSISMPWVKKAKVSGGHKAYICAHCLARGKVTPVG